MTAAALALSLTIQAIAFLLFAAGIAQFIHLVRASFLLRRMAHAGRQEYGAALLKSPLVPAVSTVATPPDASAASLQFIRRLLDLHFGRNEVVIVLDGPSEAELEVWHRELKLCTSSRVVPQTLTTGRVRGVYESRDPVRVVVIDKEPGGPVDAWNAAVNASSSPVIGILDPDSEFVPEVLLRLIQPMLEAADETVAVIAGVPVPAGLGTAAQFAALESLRSWLLRGAAGAVRNLALPFPGAALLVRRKAVLDAGGFTGGPLELFIRLHALALAAAKPYRVALLPDPISHSRPLADFAALRSCIVRDQREISAAFRHRKAIAGSFGWRALRAFYFQRVILPILEVVLYPLTILGLFLGWLDWFTAGLVALASIGMGTVLSMASVVLREMAEPDCPDERRMARMFGAAISENLIYRWRRHGWLLTGFGKSPAIQQTDLGRLAESKPSAMSAASR